MTDSAGFAIEAESATIAYRSIPILRDFSVQVKSGELLGIFGPIGAGKSTFLKSLLGLSHVISGTIRVLDRRVIRTNMPAIRRLAAYVPQCFDVDRRMPINAEEVVLMGRFGGMGILHRPNANDHAAARDALEVLAAGHLVGRPFGTLSGGERQRVIIARAMAQEPKLLLMDEPTNSLDWESQHRICELVREIHERRSLTTLVVSHDVDLLANTCDRILLMEQGQIASEHSPVEFRQCCCGRTLTRETPGSAEVRP